MKHIVELVGCDDTTKFAIELDDKELEVVKRLSYESCLHSTYGCMPTLWIDDKLIERL